ncbi:hypothetical protein [Aequorivita echinoideorum]|uniref:Uncharacterized protein n=1 Tax=Aequorivita echinoideorum TaxID=1549647 RepID=A0ABS5S3M4_9FLAO|nr:hypothetical protein [Aequorivita echinoideorum]MBT0607811.1 hypothetical protein [Aequorivita echinoideorum]
MKYIISILFIAVLIALAIGFYIQSENETTGNLIIGLSLMVGFFVVMPLFIYHRWRGKNVKDYMLTKENIEKMQAYQRDNKK